VSVEALLEVDGLSTEIESSRGRLRPVDEVSFRLQPHESVALVGESGSGKTMTALSVMRLLPRSARIVGGRVDLRRKDLARASEAEMQSIRGRDVGMVFQDPMTHLNPLMRIGDQIVDGITRHEGIGRSAARKQALETLRLVRLPAPSRAIDSYPHELSGGMRQRVLLGIALATRPALLIADEPTTALDVTIQLQIMELLRDIRRELGTAVLLITHDLGLVATFCERVYVMYAGRIVEHASVDSLFKSPQHPYSEALLKSTLRVDRKVDRFATIPGNPPSLLNVPAGCRFHPRCPFVFDRCRAEEPPVMRLGQADPPMCWLRQGVAE
jgi:peptide/nickel transport system ATP-binding protein